jgi:hypothetical protein
VSELYLPVKNGFLIFLILLCGCTDILLSTKNLVCKSKLSDSYYKMPYKGVGGHE